MRKPNPKRGYLTCGQIARAIGVSEATTRKLIDSGKLPGWKIPGGKQRRVLPNVFIAFVREHMPDQANRIKRELEATNEQAQQPEPGREVREGSPGAP